MDIIIAHPNGWGTREQGVLRTAAVRAGLTTTAKSYRQITFVSEGEASIQFCLHSAQISSSLTPGMNLVVCDAGGSTVDTTVYAVTAIEPMLELKEIKSSACIQAGAIFVDDAAERYLRQRLESAGLDEDDVDAYLKDGLEHFASFIKPNFNDSEDVLDIKIGKRKLNIPTIGVQAGRLKLAKSTVKSFFDCCVERIIGSVALQSSGVDSPHFFLVGGFGDNPYLKAVIKRRFSGSNRLTTNNVPG
ncbi:hypothetical protein FRC07_005309 [Ceratobasidium sp. 392]|nr:hypothetical protein FRC07_005309 [Ceratobasidium sp. 392]